MKVNNGNKIALQIEIIISVAASATNLRRQMSFRLPRHFFNFLCKYEITLFFVKNDLPARRSAAKTGVPGRNRTCDLQIRSLSLYPTELRAHSYLFYQK
jgi:hypothetical protein